MLEAVRVRPWPGAVLLCPPGAAVGAGAPGPGQVSLRHGNRRARVELRPDPGVPAGEVRVPASLADQLLVVPGIPYDLWWDGRELRLGPVLGVVVPGRELTRARDRDWSDWAGAYPRLRGLLFVTTSTMLDLDKGSARGYYFRSGPGGGGWSRGRFPLPEVMYRRAWLPYRLYRDLPRLGTRLFDAECNDKWRVYRWLSAAPDVAPYLPWTAPVAGAEEVPGLVRRHGRLILKWRRGFQGRGLLVVWPGEDGGYWVQGRDEPAARYCPGERELIDCLRPALEEHRYLAQHAVELPEYLRRLMDLRVIMQRDSRGQWRCTGGAARSPGGRALVSRLPAGPWARPAAGPGSSHTRRPCARRPPCRGRPPARRRWYNGWRNPYSPEVARRTVREAASRLENKLVLIDGHSLMYRAFFALPPLATADGQPTNAVYGFLNMLLRLLEEERPRYVAVAFDRGLPAFRVERYAEYKGHRPETPDDLRVQFPVVKEVLSALGIPIIEHEGYEADDLLGTLALRAREAGVERVLLVTGDRDVLQLVREGVEVLLTRKGITDIQRYDPDRIREELGIEPAQYLDVKALMGDASDNIPGVPGIGEKTALKLIRQFGDLEAVLARPDEAGGKKLPGLLRQYAEQARLSRELARIRTDAPFDFDPGRFTRREPDAGVLRPLLLRLEFRSLAQRLGLDGQEGRGSGQEGRDAGRAGAGTGTGGAAGPSLPEVEELASGEAVAGWLDELDRAAAGEPAGQDLTAGEDGPAGEYQADGENEPVDEPVSVVIALDEPAGGGPRLAGLGLATSRRAAAWVAAPGVGEDGEPGDRSGQQGGHPAGRQAGRATAPGDEPGPGMASLLAALARRPLAGFDLKPLYRLLAAAGQPAAGRQDARGQGEGGRGPAELPVPAGDVKLAAYLLDPIRNRYHLVDVARQFLEVEVEEGPADRPADPACRVPALLGRDAALCARLRPAIEAEIAARGLERVYREIELPLVPVLAAMELAGIAVDRQQLERLGRQFAERSEELARQIYELAGETFNINSTQQLGQILFERLKLPVVKKTKTGYSTDAEVLETLAARHPIAELVLEYRSLAKLRGTYVEGLAEHIGPDGRIHTTFQQTVAATGRLSSTQPNLQNIPIRDEPGRSLRRAFVAAPGHRLVAADYSQIELRVLAHYSGDRALHEAFAQGQDVHARTASEIFGVPLEQVTPDQRRVAKAVNFGLAYGQTDFGLARALRIDRAEARRFMERYFERYPGVKGYMEEMIRRARETGEVTTLLGRRRPIPEIRHRVPHIRQNAERVAINTPIQGSAADIMKLAMIRVHGALLREGLSSRIVLQVHDELIVEAPEDEVPRVAALLRREMEGAYRLDVPLVVEVKAGENWYEMEEIDP